MTTIEPGALGKTNRINLLFDFYEPLLTEKQRTFLKYYFHDDYTLGEIAAEFEISRQAIYEHIKRAEQALEGYEEKLGLLSRHETVRSLIYELETAVTRMTGQGDDKERLLGLVKALKQAEGSE
ncbi:YlxM family DNA-binding protein [Paenibacillus abyssi]|uniref:UPF0122 protein GCM10010916_31900 n=1 Tax=Paenibacillus abyssi TaxID=1340531 RepID=A0A917D5G9_9BACL|nr:YlxM family DNA-binding protein [Paenibacillus abyssi]GGG12603.1 hypothetical protein GCM10010916_31900 [Paenibacillus abyssi]